MQWALGISVEHHSAVGSSFANYLGLHFHKRTFTNKSNSCATSGFLSEGMGMLKSVRGDFLHSEEQREQVLLVCQSEKLHYASLSIVYCFV